MISDKSVTSSISLKIQSYNKIKRIREVPQTFEALKVAVENQLKDA